jgi:GNAT superfamily N-acetyltransferase
METPLIVRAASPGDIDEAVAIDDDACKLFKTVGLHVDVAPEYSRAERERWKRAMHEGNAFFADWPGGHSVGLLVLGFVSDEPYLEQLSVRSSAMRRGIGRLLLGYAFDWASERPLWLTTYGHVTWNRAFYEREGFTTIPESQCPRGIVELLAEQRRCLPAPEERIAMRAVGCGSSKTG